MLSRIAFALTSFLAAAFPEPAFAIVLGICAIFAFAYVAFIEIAKVSSRRIPKRSEDRST